MENHFHIINLESAPASRVAGRRSWSPAASGPSNRGGSGQPDSGSATLGGRVGLAGLGPPSRAFGAPLRGSLGCASRSPLEPLDGRDDTGCWPDGRGGGVGEQAEAGPRSPDRGRYLQRLGVILLWSGSPSGLDPWPPFLRSLRARGGPLSVHASTPRKLDDGRHGLAHAVSGHARVGWRLPAACVRARRGWLRLGRSPGR